MKLSLLHIKHYLSLSTLNKIFKLEKKQIDNELVLSYFTLVEKKRSKDYILKVLSKKYDQDSLITWLSKSESEKKLEYDRIMSEIHQLEHENRKYGI